MDDLDMISFAIKDMQDCYKKLGMHRHTVLFHKYSLAELKVMKKLCNKVGLSVGTLQTITATLEMQKEMIQSFRDTASNIDGLIKVREQKEAGGNHDK